ncbi:hypothetical protein TNCV_3965501 [Trichonephila clavipes]|nr:hypothetical protein TNCV_3965501 [Trichonephila clavipes]
MNLVLLNWTASKLVSTPSPTKVRPLRSSAPLHNGSLVASRLDPVTRQLQPIAFERLIPKPSEYQRRTVKIQEGIFNCGQVTRTTPKLAPPPLLTTTPHPRVRCTVNLQWRDRPFKEGRESIQDNERAARPSTPRNAENASLVSGHVPRDRH